MGKKKDNMNDRFELTELFMATAGGDYSRCNHGTIQRLKDSDGSDYCYGKIKVNQGFICARGDYQDMLGRKLDEIVLCILDYGLHEDRGKTMAIAGIEINLN